MEKRAADNSDTHRPEPENVHRDVIVVGAGIAGLLIAYYLKEAGKNVCALEADEIASGQTERTTAKITGQHGLKYRTLIKKVGSYKAKLYAQANEGAVREYESNAYFTKKTELPFEVEGALCFPDQAQFSPLDFVQYLASELEIYEYTKVISVKGNKVEACWSAQDCMPHDGIPFIGKYSVFTPDLYVATGFQKWGMTASMIAAMILRDELCGQHNPYAKLFSPQRMNFRAGTGNLFTDIGESVRVTDQGLMHTGNF